MDSKKNKTNKLIPKTQFITTFNNSGKIYKHNTDKYNLPGSLNNTASSSFQNQQKNLSINNQSQNNNNILSYTQNQSNNPMPKIFPSNYFEKTVFNPAIINTNGEKPLPRFGHSLVSINPIKICVFGGAVGEVRKIIYSNETYIYNIMTKIWIKLNLNFNQNNMKIPCGRAAHAAAANNQMQMVIYGGSNNSGLVDDKLWILHLSESNEGIWDEVEVSGITPGMRYGHSLTYMEPYFVLFGGNSNPDMTNDVWIININNNNYCQWEKINFKDSTLTPCPRLYHTCEICPYGNYRGMMIIFGGRDLNEKPLNDIWALKKYKNENFYWQKLELKNNYIMRSRYNHSMVFYNDLMIILGGKGINSSGNNPLPIEVYSTENNEGYSFDGVNMNRQTNFSYDKNIYLYGGFDFKNPQKPLGSLYKISLDKLFENNDTLKEKYINKNIILKINNNKNNNNIINNNVNKKMKFKLTQDVVIGSSGYEDYNMEDPSFYRKVNLNKLPEENKRIGESSENKNINLLLINKPNYNEALINKFIQTLLRPFDWFENDVQDIHSNLPFTDKEYLNLIEEVKPILEKDQSLIRLRSPCKVFGNLYGLYNDLMRFFESYGNPSDDSHMGDISVMQYIFLGDFCDRGYYSLEIIFLLFALKIKYPQFIYLIRGHHEDININIKYGLGDECIDRLSDDIKDPDSIFSNINQAFDLLPFGVLVDNNILMVHGGIGSSINSLEDIENLKRPVKVEQNVINDEQLKIIDLLWSEYSDDIDNIDINIERDKYKKGFIVKYGKERLNKFLDDNKINLLITSHMFVSGGFCTFNNDKLLVVFSATNYMNKMRNVGGMINIAKKNVNKKMNIIPKLITHNPSKEDTYRRNNSPSPVRISKNK